MSEFGIYVDLHTLFSAIRKCGVVMPPSGRPLIELSLTHLRELEKRK